VLVSSSSFRLLASLMLENLLLREEMYLLSFSIQPRIRPDLIATISSLPNAALSPILDRLFNNILTSIGTLDQLLTYCRVMSVHCKSRTEADERICSCLSGDFLALHRSNNSMYSSSSPPKVIPMSRKQSANTSRLSDTYNLAINDKTLP